MALAPAERLGSALRDLTAESQALALREVMYTLDAPAWRNLWGIVRFGCVCRYIDGWVGFAKGGS